MAETIRFAVIGDCHHSYKENYGNRDCLGANKRLGEILDILNERELDFVFSMGDLGDGHVIEEAPAVLETFAKSKYPVKYAIGNHDLCRRSDVEHAELIGMPGVNYEFAMGGYRFIVLNPFERSRYSRVEEDKKFYWDFRKNNPDVPVQEWPGFFRESTWSWLESTLDEAQAKGENVVIFCHVPALSDACARPEGDPGYHHPTARLVEYDRMLTLMDKYKNIRAYIAGHYHPGGLVIRKGVMHKTVRSVCDHHFPTACIVVADAERIKIDGIGMETSFIHYFD